MRSLQRIDNKFRNIVMLFKFETFSCYVIDLSRYNFDDRRYIQH